MCDTIRIAQGRRRLPVAYYTGEFVESLGGIPPSRYLDVQAAKLNLFSDAVAVKFTGLLRYFQPARFHRR